MYRAPAGVRKPTSFTLSTRMPSDTFARMGFSCGSNASSVIERSVMRTGVMRFLFHTNTVSADSMGRISTVPSSDKISLAINTPLDGYTSSSSDESCGWIPSDMAVESPLANWSVASISPSHLIVSTGGPFSRMISVRSGSSPTVCGFSERVSVSGLYCSMILPSGIPVVGSSDRIAPFCSRGEMLDMGASPRSLQRDEKFSRYELRGLLRRGSGRKFTRIEAADLYIRHPPPIQVVMPAGQSAESFLQSGGEPLLLACAIALQGDLPDPEAQSASRRHAHGLGCALFRRCAWSRSSNRPRHSQPRVSAAV